MEDFIGVFENAYSSDFCKKIINFFDKMEVRGCTFNRGVDGTSKMRKDDLALFMHSSSMLNLTEGDIEMEFNLSFWKKYMPIYVDRFQVLKETAPFHSYATKIQRTEVGQGYHQWHFEAESKNTCHRLMAWMLYLNTIESGGETEFLYQKERIKPEEGTLLIWPAGFTHTHRGNPPLSGTKYVMTGWIEF